MITTDIKQPFTIDQIQYETMSSIEQDQRFDIIHSIIQSLSDPTWDKDTRLINRKYLNKPENYQIFEVAKLFEKAVGFAIVRKDNDHDATSYLSFIVIHANFQKKGIATALLKNTIEKIQSMGMSKMILDCEEKQSSFYKNFADTHNFPHSKMEVGKYSFDEMKMRMTITLS